MPGERGEGARGTERGGQEHRNHLGFFQWKYRRCRARLNAGQGTRGQPRHPRDSPERTRADGQITGAANKDRGSGAGLHRGARQRPAARGTRAPARAPRRVTFLLHLEQQLFFPFPSPPPLPLLSSWFIPACSSSHSLPPSAILQACDVGSRSPLTHI